jgi:polyhydroxyalkanoate synthesis regulator phasin
LRQWPRPNGLTLRHGRGTRLRGERMKIKDLRDYANVQLGLNIGPADVRRLVEDINRELSEARQIKGAPAGSELGVELSKIRDRLNALEGRFDALMASMRPVPAEEDTKALDERVSALERSVTALMYWQKRLREGV